MYNEVKTNFPPLYKSIASENIRNHLGIIASISYLNSFWFCLPKNTSDSQFQWSWTSSHTCLVLAATYRCFIS